jgi:ABC-type lipoprotein release transport system permease subunit
MVGETIALGIGPQGSPAGRPATIVGIVEDVKYQGPMGLRPRDHDIYVPLSQAPGQVLSIAVHTRVDGARLREELVQLVSARAPTSPMHWISTMDEELGLQIRDARLYAMLTGLFGSGAIILVLLGLYGVIANAVARRLPELSIRMAVGATPSHVAMLVARQVVVPSMLGVAVGGGVAMVASRLARSLVYGIESTDPVTFASVAGLLLAASLVAALAPARRAARVDPAAALTTN